MTENYTHDTWLDETLKSNNRQLPHALYKFLSSSSKYFSENAKELIFSSRIRLSGRDALNDPFDSRPMLLPPPTADELRKFWERISIENDSEITFDKLLSHHSSDLNSICNHMQQEINQSIDKIGVYSLTARIDHPLMWAHYASSYSGLAWIFVHAVEGVDFGAMPVRYQSDYPSVQTADTRGLIEQLLVKGLDWSYEDEWRFVESKCANTWLKIDSNALRGVVFGPNTEMDVIDFVMKLCDERVRVGLRPLRIYGTKLKNGVFGLDFFRLAPNKEMIQVDMPTPFDTLLP